MNIYIGTSGWSYNHWRKIFYPENIPKYKFFEYYCTKFNTVEINATFYRKFKETTFKNWYKISPGEFLFSLKAPKVITHIKKLKDIKSDLDDFFYSLSLLKDKIGVILFQLPPSLKFDKVLLENFFRILSNYNYRFALEVRNKSFNNKSFFNIMKYFNITLCFSDTGGRYSSFFEIDTGHFLYLRLHGPDKLYASKYTLEQLEKWKQLVLKYYKDTFVYFDNDYYGYAPVNALEFMKMFNYNTT